MSRQGKVQISHPQEGLCVKFPTPRTQTTVKCPVVARGEMLKLQIDSAILESTKKSIKYAVNVFEGQESHK